MENKKKNEELQSRREFFKKAAKGALPILAGALLVANPVVAKAAESSMSCAGCNNRCMNSCDNTCYRSCRAYCTNGTRKS